MKPVSIFNAVINAGSGTTNIPAESIFGLVEISGTETLTGTWNINFTGTEHDRAYITIVNKAVLTISGGALVIEGVTVPAELVGGLFHAYGYWDGSAWSISFHPDWAENDTVTVDQLGDDSVDTDAIIDEAVTLAKQADLARGSIITGQTASNKPTALDAKTDGNILVGDGTDLNSVAVSGDVTIDSAGVVTISNGAVDTVMLANDAVDYSKLDSPENRVIMTPLLIFHTGTVGDIKFEVPWNADLIGMHASVHQVISTDDATVQAKNDSAASMAGGLITALAAASTIGDTFTATPTTNNHFNSGEILTLTTAKSTLTTTSGMLAMTLIFELVAAV